MKTSKNGYSLCWVELTERFPLTAACFRASRSWRSNKEHDIAKELVTFLDLEDLVIINAIDKQK